MEMRLDDFIGKIEDYYSEYKPLVLHEVREFLSTYRAETLFELYYVCIHRYPSRNREGFPNSPPDVWMIDQVLAEAILNAEKNSRRVEAAIENRAVTRDAAEEAQAFDFFQEMRRILKMKDEKTKAALKPPSETERRELLRRQARELEGK